MATKNAITLQLPKMLRLRQLLGPMFLIFISLAAVLPLPSRAEDATWSKNNAEFMHLYSKGLYDQALPLVLTLLDYSEQTFGPEHVTTGRSLNSRP